MSPTENDNSGSIGSMLVATDFSVNADRAVRFATDLARHLDATLTLVHAVEPGAMPTMPLAIQEAASSPTSPRKRTPV